MAKAAYTGVIERLLGKAGGTVYTQSHGGPIAKAYVVGLDPHTPAQQMMRHWIAISA